MFFPQRHSFAAAAASCASPGAWAAGPPQHDCRVPLPPPPFVRFVYFLVRLAGLCAWQHKCTQTAPSLLRA